MRLATVNQEVCQPIRLVNQMASGGSCVAIFTLRITPTPDSQDVTFSSKANDPHLESWMETAVEKGVREFVEQRERDGRPVGCFHVALTDIRVHPWDSKAIGFMRAAIMAMT
ncbi:MAG TPA: hypothetical protein VF988_00180, partial [Verrucomicrobiae bacterium]